MTKKTSREAVKMLLRERILAGDLARRSDVPEASLADELAISPDVLQEALACLAGEGMLHAGPGKSFAVASFTMADALDALELRGVLEGTAARLAAERSVPLERMARLEHVVYALDEVLEGWRSEIDLDRYGNLNDRFHRALRSLPGSRLIEDELDRLCRVPFGSPSPFIHGRSNATAFRLSLVAGQAQHRAIVDAISTGEGWRAESVAREHARLARQNLEDAFTADRGSSSSKERLSLVVDHDRA